MTIRQRKFVGVLATVGFLIVYSLIAMAVGGAFVIGQSKLLEIVYFIIAGIAWLPPAMLIIRWMSRP
jgi:uncharacterized protein DUF2842